MKRTLLFISLGLALAFVAYANLRHVNPSVLMEPIDVRTFELKSLHGTPLDQLKEIPKSNEAIKAVAVYMDQKTVGVTYEYQKISEDQLIQSLSYNGAFEVAKKTFASNGKACPVHGALAFWEKALNMLRFVD